MTTSHQLTFADSEFNNKGRKTRKEIFLSRMDELMPWDQSRPWVCLLGCRWTKNDNKLSMLFALANVFIIDQMIRAARGSRVRSKPTK